MKTVLPLLAEYFGTFLLGLAYLSSVSIVWLAAIFSVILFLTIPISGGCINPAISLIKYLNGSLGTTELALYTAVQMLAGTTSFYVFKLLG